MMNFSRVNPSPRYKDLISQYCQMHRDGERFLQIPPEETFPGLSLPSQAKRIKRLIDLTSAQTILDYGSGKGKQYEISPFKLEGESPHESIMDYWDVSVHCYDPCYHPYSNIPEGKFDGVISTDVLEHCPDEDIPWILAEIFSYADLFVFGNVACYPARKRLPSGENAHITIKPAEWWEALIKEIASNNEHLTWEFWIQTVDGSPQGRKMVETRLGN